MEELFDLGQTGSEHTDISLCIFPHLKEFLAIDLRWDSPRVELLDVGDVLDDSFFTKVEQDFSRILRESTEYPFAHLIDLPLRVEELVRETGMLAILRRLGEGAKDEELPTVAVFIISGAALAMNSDQISLAVQSLLGERADQPTALECSRMLERLLFKEQEVVKRIDRQELREALEDQSPNYFTLWERRN